MAIQSGPAALVTGGCGFVGRHVTLRLLADGYNVWIVDDESTGRDPRSWVPGAITWENLGENILRSSGENSVTYIHADVRDFFREMTPTDNPTLYASLRASNKT